MVIIIEAYIKIFHFIDLDDMYISQTGTFIDNQVIR